MSSFDQTKICQNSESRDLRVDILKVIGLFCIILAHVGTGQVIFQVRNFDVPLMVICSGALFFISTKQTNLAYSAYVKKRLERLLAPSWMFLIIYFSLIYSLNSITKNNFPYSSVDILQEFILRSKIIGLWIIRVFILVSLIAPFIFNLYLRVKNEMIFLLILLGVYLFYEACYGILSIYNSSLIFKLMEKSIFEMIPYGCLFGIGISLAHLKKRTILVLSMIFLAIFVFLFLIKISSGYPVDTQLYKYPPRLYYLSYAIFVSLLLWIVFSYIEIKNRIALALILFLSSSSLWIYLWHWFILYYSLSIERKLFYSASLSRHSFVTFSIVVIASIVLTFLQKKVVIWILQKIPMKERTGKMLSIIFLN
jgi:peptidoglycan/LPS O-acetylase OafA/YrhL